MTTDFNFSEPQEFAKEFNDYIVAIRAKEESHRRLVCARTTHDDAAKRLKELEENLTRWIPPKKTVRVSFRNATYSIRWEAVCGNIRSAITREPDPIALELPDEA